MNAHLISRMVHALRFVDDVRNPIERAKAYEENDIPQFVIRRYDDEAMEAVLRIRAINENPSGKVNYK